MTPCDVYKNRFESHYTAVLEMHAAPSPALINTIVLIVYEFTK